MEEFPGNSHKSRRPEVPDPGEKRVQRVVQNAVTQRKKPFRRRLLESFGGGDARGVFSFVLMDVLVPAARDMIADAGRETVERMVYGETTASRRSHHYPSSPYGAGYVNYTTTPTGPAHRPDPRAPLSRRARTMHDFKEIVFATRFEADAVFENLWSRLNTYDQVTVRDLYEMTNIAPDYPDERFGWTNLNGASVIRVKGGYVIDLPRPQELD